MIYTTNWIERLNKDFRRTTKMRGALPKVNAALLLLGGVAMDKSCYKRKVPKLDYEKDKFNWEE
jgi:transposase-like protein